MRDLQRKYPEGIKLGGVAVSTGGNLHCQEIYHGVLCKWESDHEIAKRVIILNFALNFCNTASEFNFSKEK